MLHDQPSPSSTTPPAASSEEAGAQGGATEIANTRGLLDQLTLSTSRSIARFYCSYPQRPEEDAYSEAELEDGSAFHYTSSVDPLTADIQELLRSFSLEEVRFCRFVFDLKAVSTAAARLTGLSREQAEELLGRVRRCVARSLAFHDSDATSIDTFAASLQLDDHPISIDVVEPYITGPLAWAHLLRTDDPFVQAFRCACFWDRPEGDSHRPPVEKMGEKTLVGLMAYLYRRGSSASPYSIELSASLLCLFGVDISDESFAPAEPDQDLVARIAVGRGMYSGRVLEDKQLLDSRDGIPKWTVDAGIVGPLKAEENRKVVLYRGAERELSRGGASKLVRMAIAEMMADTERHMVPPATSQYVAEELPLLMSEVAREIGRRTIALPQNRDAHLDSLSQRILRPNDWATTSRNGDRLGNTTPDLLTLRRIVHGESPLDVLIARYPNFDDIPLTDEVAALAGLPRDARWTESELLSRIYRTGIYPATLPQDAPFTVRGRRTYYCCPEIVGTEVAEEVRGRCAGLSAVGMTPQQAAKLGLVGLALIYPPVAIPEYALAAALSTSHDFELLASHRDPAVTRLRQRLFRSQDGIHLEHLGPTPRAAFVEFMRRRYPSIDDVPPSVELAEIFGHRKDERVPKLTAPSSLSTLPDKRAWRLAKKAIELGAYPPVCGPNYELARRSNLGFLLMAKVVDQEQFELNRQTVLRSRFPTLDHARRQEGDQAVTKAVKALLDLKPSASLQDVATRLVDYGICTPIIPIDHKIPPWHDSHYFDAAVVGILAFYNLGQHIRDRYGTIDALIQVGATIGSPLGVGRKTIDIVREVLRRGYLTTDVPDGQAPGASNSGTVSTWYFKEDPLTAAEIVSNIRRYLDRTLVFLGELRNETKGARNLRQLCQHYLGLSSYAEIAAYAIREGLKSPALPKDYHPRSEHDIYFQVAAVGAEWAEQNLTTWRAR